MTWYKPADVGFATRQKLGNLGYGARLLRPVFARPFTWKVLDVLIGLTMGALALKLLLGG